MSLAVDCGWCTVGKMQCADFDFVINWLENFDPIWWDFSFFSPMPITVKHDKKLR